MTLSTELRAWRRIHGLSQGGAAVQLGVSRRSLENWEQGVNAPTGLALTALLALLQKKTLDNCPRVGDSLSVRERQPRKRKASR